MTNAIFGPESGQCSTKQVAQPYELSKKRYIHSQVAIDKIAYDDKTGQTDVLRICLAHGLTEAVKMIRTKRAEFIRARGNKTS